MKVLQAPPLPRPGPLFGPYPLRPSARPTGPWALLEQVLPAWRGGRLSSQRRCAFAQALQPPTTEP